jgi:ABC-2 type transport system permease protein
MSLIRIQAVVLRQWYEFINQWSRIFDTFFWPIIDLMLWGLTFFYIEATTPEISLSKVIIGALIFSNFLYSVQRDFTMGFLQEVWDRNLYNIFATPLTKEEIIVGSAITTFLKTMLLVVIVTLTAYTVFDFNFFDLLPVFFGGLTTVTLFGICFGILTTSFIFHFGSQVQTLVWSGLGIIMPLLCIYYPVTALPETLQHIAWLLPPTYVFEYVRAFINDQTIPTALDWLWPTLLNIFYISLAIWYFKSTFRKAHQRGWFVKMD